ncbi:MAG: hypothetical protein HFE62_03840 [Firmicutes bacterium]|nr:hypothetical protein [Bacillota bacterium]
MSKKVSEFDRYARMKKMEKEAEAEKRREKFFEMKHKGRPKASGEGACRKNIGLIYDEFEDFDF